MAIFNSELLVYQRVPVIKRGWDNPYLDGWFYKARWMVLHSVS